MKTSCSKPILMISFRPHLGIEETDEVTPTLYFSQRSSVFLSTIVTVTPYFN